MNDTIKKNKLFISHASADKDFVEILLRFIYEGCGLLKDDVFCTSQSGTLLPGELFIDDIKNNVLNSECVVFLMSENYLDSYFCIAELGAAWVLNKHIIPVVVPPVTLQEYDRTPLKGIQYLDGSSSDMPMAFREKLTKIGVTNTLFDDSTFANAENIFRNSVQNYLKFLHKDSNGFYRARIVERASRDITMIPNLSGQGWALGTPNGMTPWYLRRFFLYKLNGFIQSDASISYEAEDTAHWFAIEGLSLEKNDKIKFKIKGRHHEFDSNHEKVIILSEWHNESYR